MTMGCRVAIVLLVLASCVFAQDATTTPSEPSAAFPQGTQTFGLQTIYQQERTGKDRYFADLTASWGHYFLDNAAFELQAVSYITHDDNEEQTQDTFGIGANALARYHLINIGRFSFYGDVLGGTMMFSDRFPNGGTSLNFTYAGGPGVSWKLKDNLYLDGGIRFQHLSNFFIEGRDHNPILNSFGGYVGLMWTR